MKSSKCIVKMLKNIKKIIKKYKKYLFFQRRKNIVLEQNDIHELTTPKKNNSIIKNKHRELISF